MSNNLKALTLTHLVPGNVSYVKYKILKKEKKDLQLRPPRWSSEI